MIRLDFVDFLWKRPANNAQNAPPGHSFSLWHLAFLIDGDATAGQKYIEALPQCIVGRGVRSHFCGDLFLDCHALCVDHLDDAEVGYGHIQATKLVIVPDGIWRACNRHPGEFSTAGEIERDDCASIASDKDPAALLIEVQPVR